MRRNAFALALAAIVAVTFAAGCGGKQRAGTPTLATQAAEPPSPAAAEPPPAATEPPPAATEPPPAATEPPPAATETAQAGMISTVAGTGEAGFSGDGGPATAAELHMSGDEIYLRDVAVDDAGNLYIADWYNHRVRKVDPAGVITTVAGTGEPGLSGDGGPATEALLYWPAGLAANAAGDLYVAAYANQGVRQIDTTGVIRTVAGTGHVGLSGDGGPATEAELNYPNGLALDEAGNLYVADSCNQRIRRIDTAGVITTVAGSGPPALDLSDCQDFLGDFAGDGGPATEARLKNPLDVALDAAGNLYIADTVNNRLRKVDSAGVITTIAGTGEIGFSGDDGPAIEAELCAPSGLTLDAAGNLYIADRCNERVRKILLVVS